MRFSPVFPASEPAPSHLTKLLLPLSSDYQDISDSAHTVTYSGATPLIDNNGGTNTPFGAGNSLRQPSSPASTLIVPDSADFDFGDGDFTLEFWHYPGIGQGGTIPLLTKRADDSHAYGPFHLVYSATSLQFYASSVGSTSWDLVNGLSMPSHNASFPANTAWYHYAITREGNVWRSFWRGVLQNSVTQAGTMQSNSAAVGFGTNRIIRYSELRITKGLARYTANFTPSTTRFTPD